MLPAWLDAPEDVVDAGFWATLDWWLQRTEEFVEVGPGAQPDRPDRPIRHRARAAPPIDRFMRSEDPYGTLEFVEFGVAARRGPR